MTEVSKTSRTTAKRFFTRSENALHQALDTEALEETVMRRFNDYKRRWEIAQEAHDKYIEELGTVTEDEIETEDLWLNELAERFYNLEVRVDNTLHERKEKNTAELDRAKEELISKAKEELDKQFSKQSILRGTSESTYVKSNGIQLERMTFDKFSGNIRSYPKFKEEFNTHIRPLCSVPQLPFVLKSYLKDEVKEEVDDVKGHYEEIRKRLDEKFGDKGRLIDTIMADIKYLKPCSNSDDENTLKLIKTVEKAHCDLMRLREDDQMNNAAILSMIEQKLPDKILDEWIKEVSNKSIDPRSRFSSMMRLLADWRK